MCVFVIIKIEIARTYSTQGHTIKGHTFIIYNNYKYFFKELITPVYRIFIELGRKCANRISYQANRQKHRDSTNTCDKVCVMLSKPICGFRAVSVSSDRGAASDPIQIGLNNDTNTLTQIFILSSQFQNRYPSNQNMKLTKKLSYIF